MPKLHVPGATGLALALAAAWPAPPAAAHDDDGHHEAPLHFSHPLFTESPSPDTKLRLDWFYARLPGEGEEAGAADEEGGLLAAPADFHTFRLEAEYAFSPSLSIEVDIPVSIRNPAEGLAQVSAVDTLEVGLKYANFAFAEHGLLLGGGIEFGLPTGSDGKGIGSDHIVEIEPFIDFGFKRGSFELVGFVAVGLPVNDRPEDGAADAELGVDISALYHVAPALQLLVELNGEHVYGGEEAGLDAWNVSPGLKLRPWRGLALDIGAGVQIPLNGTKEQKVRTVLSLFYHF